MFRGSSGHLKFDKNQPVEDLSWRPLKSTHLLLLNRLNVPSQLTHNVIFSKVTISSKVCSTGDPVEEDGGVPPHQEEGDPGPGMAGVQEKPALPHLAPHLGEQLSPSAVPGCSSQFPG